MALLSHQGLGQVLEGAPKVQWGGWGDLPPPRAGAHPSYRLLSPVATAFVTRPRPPGTSEVTLRFQHPPPVSEGGPDTPKRVIGGVGTPKGEEDPQKGFGTWRGGRRLGTPKGDGDTWGGH